MHAPFPSLIGYQIHLAHCCLCKWTRQVDAFRVADQHPTSLSVRHKQCRYSLFTFCENTHNLRQRSTIEQLPDGWPCIIATVKRSASQSRSCSSEPPDRWSASVESQHSKYLDSQCTLPRANGHQIQLRTRQSLQCPRLNKISARIITVDWASTPQPGQPISPIR